MRVTNCPFLHLAGAKGTQAQEGRRNLALGHFRGHTTHATPGNKGGWGVTALTRLRQLAPCAVRHQCGGTT